MSKGIVAPALLALILSCGLLAGPVEAKDIKLGGEQNEHKLPLNTIELPQIAVAIRTEDGGWRHIRISAWLAAKDASTARTIDRMKNSIVGKADRELPNHSFDTLLSPELGSVEAKKAIRIAVEATLGHPYNGDILIRNLLVY